ncbi:MAG: tyrosine-type recombinase/integrase, partial [Negativicutes bacterium]|nr:tyrosine-type recombinase/integrase [Negativicutes bacterium]
MSVIRKLREVKPKDTFEFGKAFIFHQEARGLAKTTMRVQKDIINILMAHAPKDAGDERAWLDVVTKLLTSKKPAYYNKMLTTMKQFFQYLIAEGVVTTNPADRFKYRKEGNRIVRHSEETIKRLLNVINKDTFAGLRDYTFCTLMLDTGIRPSEAVQIRIEDIDFERKQVHVK